VETLPLHPKLVHLPLAVSVLVPVVGALVLAAWIRGWVTVRAWWVVVVVQLLGTGAGIAAMQAGEDEEERVERFVPHEAIETHEETAEVFVWTGAGVLVLALLAGAVRADPIRWGLAAATIALGAIVLWMGIRTGEAGGRLVYVHGAARAYTESAAGGAAPAAPPAAADHDHDDDDD